MSSPLRSQLRTQQQAKAVVPLPGRKSISNSASPLKRRSPNSAPPTKLTSSPPSSSKTTIPPSNPLPITDSTSPPESTTTSSNPTSSTSITSSKPATSSSTLPPRVTTKLTPLPTLPKPSMISAALRNSTSIGSSVKLLTSSRLGITDSELSTAHTEPDSQLVPICNNRSDNKTTGGSEWIKRLETLQNISRGNEGVGSFHESENVTATSIDKVLERWKDSINQAEQEFEQEELAYERSQMRLSPKPPLSQTPSMRVVEKAKKLVSRTNERIRSPIRKIPSSSTVKRKQDT